MKVAIALSGGIDSSFSAYVLKKNLPSSSKLLAITFDNGYFSTSQIETAKKVARFLNIEHLVIDVKKLFKEKIINPFIQFYKNGLTPNPCVFCNLYLKFGYLLDFVVEKLSFSKLATGHYVSLKTFEDFLLFAIPKDKKKDQTYFLSLVPQKKLKHLIFPLENFTKEEVIDLVKTANIPCMVSKSSQDICFLQNNSLKNFLTLFIPQKEGEIIYKGKVVGKHHGFYWYTIGQRKGLNLPLGKPVYIIEIRPEENQIIVGDEKDLYKESCLLVNINFYLPFSIVEKLIEKGIYAKVRYRSGLKRVKKIEMRGEEALVKFAEPVKAITPGQICAFYYKEFLIGGGIIKKAI